MMKKHLIFLISAFLLLGGFFVSCSDSDDDGDDLVTTYSYNLTSNETYYRVFQYRSIDNGDNTYNVKELSIHNFLKTSETYADCTGSQLCAVVKDGSATPYRSEAYTLSSDKTNYSDKGKTTQRTYYLPSGLEYEVKYYK